MSPKVVDLSLMSEFLNEITSLAPAGHLSAVLNTIAKSNERGDRHQGRQKKVRFVQPGLSSKRVFRPGFSTPASTSTLRTKRPASESLENSTKHQRLMNLYVPPFSQLFKYSIPEPGPLFLPAFLDLSNLPEYNSANELRLRLASDLLIILGRPEAACPIYLLLHKKEEKRTATSQKDLQMLSAASRCATEEVHARVVRGLLEEEIEQIRNIRDLSNASTSTEEVELQSLLDAQCFYQFAAELSKESISIENAVVEWRKRVKELSHAGKPTDIELTACNVDMDLRYAEQEDLGPLLTQSAQTLERLVRSHRLIQTTGKEISPRELDATPIHAIRIAVIRCSFILKSLKDKHEDSDEQKYIHFVFLLLYCIIWEDLNSPTSSHAKEQVIARGWGRFSGRFVAKLTAIIVKMLGERTKDSYSLYTGTKDTDPFYTWPGFSNSNCPRSVAVSWSVCWQGPESKIWKDHVAEALERVSRLPDKELFSWFQDHVVEGEIQINLDQSTVKDFVLQQTGYIVPHHPIQMQYAKGQKAESDVGKSDGLCTSVLAPSIRSSSSSMRNSMNNFKLALPIRSSVASQEIQFPSTAIPRSQRSSGWSFQLPILPSPSITSTSSHKSGNPRYVEVHHCPGSSFLIDVTSSELGPLRKRSNWGLELT
jgi:hypothetical protein